MIVWWYTIAYSWLPGECFEYSSRLWCLTLALSNIKLCSCFLEYDEMKDTDRIKKSVYWPLPPWALTYDVRSDSITSGVITMVTNKGVSSRRGCNMVGFLSEPLTEIEKKAKVSSRVIRSYGRITACVMKRLLYTLRSIKIILFLI